jgi:hypothetical protein
MTGESSKPSGSGEDTGDHVAEASSLIGIDSLWSGQLLYVAVDLGVIDLLDAEPTAARTVAEELDLHADACYRFLRALSHFDVLDEDDERRFSLTPVGELFLADHPHSLRHALRVDRSPEWIRPMLHLDDVLQEGRPTGFERTFETDFFDYLEANPDFAEAFNEHMSARTEQEAELVLEALADYEFEGLDHVCDVGGGHGLLLCRLLEAEPHLEGTVLELESVLAEEDSLWAPKLGVEDRCTYAAGDMFEAVPQADAYLLKVILHDWEDDECVDILSTVHDAAPPNGRLFVVEALVPGPNEPHFAKRLDMTMMVHVGGRERTLEEYGTLFERAGWTLVERWEPPEGPLSVLEARKA